MVSFSAGSIELRGGSRFAVALSDDLSLAGSFKARNVRCGVGSRRVATVEFSGYFVTERTRGLSRRPLATVAWYD